MNTFDPFEGEFDAAPAQAVDNKADAAQDGAAKKFRKEIDLGDGGGVQVFEADSQDELIDKLTEAQRNATAEIRKLQRGKPRAKPEREAKKPDRIQRPFDAVPLTAEEELQLAQEFTERPSRALSTLLERVYGVKPQQLRSTVEDLEEIKAQIDEARAAQDFVQAHLDDYSPTPKNFEKLMSVLEEEELSLTRNNLEYAFQQAGSELAPPVKEKPAEPGIQEPAQLPKQQPRRVTGLSGASKSASTESDAELVDVNEILSGSLQEARAKVQAALRRQRESQGQRS